MSIDLSQFLPTFLEESYEGLDIMESGLLNLVPGDDESIHAIFRAAHSIKGGAGTFGFVQVTEFTHLVETLLDEMRDGRRDISQPDIEILLESVDCIRILMEAEKQELQCEDAKILATKKLLEKSLSDTSNASSIDINADIDQSNDKETLVKEWKITFIPEHHLVQTGNDPLFLFNALAELGDTVIHCNTASIPPLNDLEPEDIHLSWVIELKASCDESDITEIFEWVEDECELIIELITLIPHEEPLKTASKDTRIDVTPEIKTEQVQSAKASQHVNTVKDKTPATAALEKAAEKNTINKPKQDAGSIRVGVDKVDSLINLVGELVITQSMLSELGNDFDLHKVEKLNAGLEQLLQNTKELQESVMRIRMLPISFAFNRFPRLIHDLSIKTGKEIELIIKGEQTELDKTVMEQIGDPLIHLVRNAVDHGIESSEDRIAVGKSSKGTISLDAFHQGGNIVIEISDDGGGINRKAVFDKAVEKNIIDNTATLSDGQVFDLLFEPGFSTAKELSDISGRGVGMDVVKRNIQALGGRIQVESEQGKGSTFRVHLPLTLAILDGQLVKVGSEVFIIPLVSIVESLQIKPTLINRVSGDLVLYRLRDENIPVLPVYRLFNINADHTDVENALLVVVEAEGQKLGLMVDDLLAQQQVVIKSLVDNYQQVDGISGATILGDGSVAMIIDVMGFMTMAMHVNQQASRNELAMEGNN